MSSTEFMNWNGEGVGYKQPLILKNKTASEKTREKQKIKKKSREKQVYLKKIQKNY